MQVDKFYKDSFILTLSNMVTGIIAFLFSIILSRELGAEGLGLYGLIMPVYSLLLCITSEGLITANSKISTVYFSRKDYKNLHKTIGTVLMFVIVWATSVAVLVMLFSKGVASVIVRDTRAANAIRIVGPAILFVPLSAVLKGYFYGLGKYKVTALVDIVEKLLRVVILLSAISILAPKGVDRTVTIAFFSLAVGELASLAMLYTCYRIQRSRFDVRLGRGKSRIQLLFDIFVISVPLCLNGVLSSVLSTISALVLPRCLVTAGFSYRNALALIGRFGGMALNISYLPFIIIGSMLTVLVPELSLHISRKDYWSAQERITQVLKLAAAVGIATASVCLTIPGTLGQLFYQRNDLGEMIRFSSAICLISYVASPTFGILNALGRQNILLKNSLVISIESLLLVILLASIPALNIFGYGLSMILTSATAFVINIREIRKICEIKIPLQDFVTLILTGAAACLAAGIAARLLSGAVPAVQAALVAVVSFGTVFGCGSLFLGNKAS